MAKKLTPMMEQYLSIKECYKDELLFFRLGDFYELFMEDALLASKELNIALTGRSAGQEDKVPMCGVPFHAAENYITKLIDKGYKVAICEQTEEAGAVKGIVKREVVKVITPGTALLENKEVNNDNNFLALFYGLKERLIILFTDISTGETIWLTHETDDRFSNIIDALVMYNPSEIIVVNDFVLESELKNFVNNSMEHTIITELNIRTLEKYFTLNNWHLDDKFLDYENLVLTGQSHFSKYVTNNDFLLAALGALYNYLTYVIKTTAEHINYIHAYDSHKHLILDHSCLNHLEITRNLRNGHKKGTLYGILDKTQTPMGTRLLKQWIENPLLDQKDIIERQDAVEVLLQQNLIRAELKEYLKMIFDFERILTKIETGSASSRDLVALRESIGVLPQLKTVLNNCSSKLLDELNNKIATHEDLFELLKKAIAENPASTFKNGGIIADGYNTILDELRLLATNSQELLAKLEEDTKSKTGIKLKTGYNKVFGYFFEVSNTHVDKVPDYFIRKQTLANAERYITPELKEFEIKILTAKDKIIAIEQELFAELRDIIKTQIECIQITARALASIDVLQGLAEVAYEGRYIRPNLNNKGIIQIQDGRHPVIEKYLQKEIYIPNDVNLDHNSNEFILITGPNMAGKSTYMRQVAILMIMAQIGSFIPAAKANICPVDRIFTRVGASDDISTGQSTFMIEMKEVAYILDNATENSLIILDEIGRGTSTFDGLSIAKAVVEFIVKNIKAKTLFATHYHELVTMSDEFDKLQNYTVAVKEKGKDIIFMRRIVKGGTDRSYGIHVAKLAGIPNSVLKRAQQILETLETEDNKSTNNSIPNKQIYKSNEQFGNLFNDPILEKLKNLDVMSMTPLEALNILYQLREEALTGEGK